MEYLIGNTIGITNILIGFPLDTLKVHFQRNNKLPALKLSLLYSGVKFPMYSSLLSNTIVFGNYKKINTVINNDFLTGFILGGLVV